MVLMSSWSLGLSIDMWFVNFGRRLVSFSFFLVVSGNYRGVGTEIEYQLVKFGKIEVVLVKLDVFRNYCTVQFREISFRVKSPNFGYQAYRAHCVIGPVGVQLGWFHGSKSYSKVFEASQCCWFSYWSLSGVLFILQALTPGRETILQGSGTEHL